MGAFGRALTDAREKAGLSKVSLSRKLKISAYTVYCYETGRRFPKRTGIILKMADALSIPREQLLTLLLEDLGKEDDNDKEGNRSDGRAGR